MGPQTVRILKSAAYWAPDIKRCHDFTSFPRDQVSQSATDFSMSATPGVPRESVWSICRLEISYARYFLRHCRRCNTAGIDLWLIGNHHPSTQRRGAVMLCEHHIPTRTSSNLNKVNNRSLDRAEPSFLVSFSPADGSDVPSVVPPVALEPNGHLWEA